MLQAPAPLCPDNFSCTTIIIPPNITHPALQRHLVQTPAGGNPTPLEPPPKTISCQNIATVAKPGLELAEFCLESAGAQSIATERVWGAPRLPFGAGVMTAKDCQVIDAADISVAGRVGSHQWSSLHQLINMSYI